MIQKVPVEGKWLQYDDQTGEYWHGNKFDTAKHGEMPESDLRMIELRRIASIENPLRFFLPHGLEWSAEERVLAGGKVVLPAACYDEAYGNDGVGFLSDHTRQLMMMMAPRKTGKSIVGAVKMALNIVKCDPSWEIFTEHGVAVPEWRGPQQVVVSSLMPMNLAELWHAYLEILPRDLLGQYAPNWGCVEGIEGEEGRQKAISFGDTRPRDSKLLNQSRILFLTYNQKQSNWLNFRASIWHSDEQSGREHVMAFQNGATTMGAYTPIICTLSGFRVPERPDTGAGGLMHKMWNGSDTMGFGDKDIGRYSMSLTETPDCIIHPERKKQLYDAYANPDIERSQQAERHGLAVFYGGWEVGGGLMFEEVERRTHMIEPPWGESAPEGATLYRSCDHGETSPMACSWIALFPPNNEYAKFSFAVVYRLHYEAGARIANHAPEIIEKSGNQRVKVDVQRDDEDGTTFDVYEEVFTGERYYSTLMDPRSWAMPANGIPIAYIYSRHGLETEQSPGDRNYSDASAGKRGQNDFLRDWLHIDRNLDHPFLRDKDGEPIKGSPRLFMADIPCMRPLIDEFESYRRGDKDPERPATNQDDHAIDTLKFWAAQEPQPADLEGYDDHVADDWIDDDQPLCGRTGY